jgi:hypothetical protein
MASPERDASACAGNGTDAAGIDVAELGHADDTAPQSENQSSTPGESATAGQVGATRHLVTGAAAPDSGAVNVGTDTTRRIGASISDLGASVAVRSVDRTLLTEDNVGDAGLARALNEFVTCWHDQLGEYAAHLEDIGQAVTQAGARYQAADDAVADDLSRLDSLETPISTNGSDR